MSEQLKATRHDHGLKTFEDVINEHSEAGHVIVSVVFFAPDGTMSIELDANAHELIPEIIARLQAVSRALAN